MGLDVDYKNATMKWNGMTVVMKSEDFPTCKAEK